MKLNKFELERMSVAEKNAIKAGSAHTMTGVGTTQSNCVDMDEAHGDWDQD